MRPYRGSATCEFREFPHHPFIGRSLERHHEIREVRHWLPFPGDEFGIMDAASRRRNVDLAIVAGEAQRIPLLGLAAIPAAPCLADDAARNVIGEPVVNLSETLDRSDAGLLIKFP